jgi:hypothetical protein
MAFDEELAARIREQVAHEDGLSEQRMFGGLAFLINRNMAVAASSEGGLLVRADPAEADAWVDGDRVSPMVMRGREMSGWLRVSAPVSDDEVELWAARGVAFARSLPPKAGT